MAASGTVAVVLPGAYYALRETSCHRSTRCAGRLPPPLFSGRIFGSAPERGDVVVFRLPKEDPTDYIKRVIGLPGDRIQMIEACCTSTASRSSASARGYRRHEDGPASSGQALASETLPNGVIYYTLDLRRQRLRTTIRRSTTVPPDHYFMMGDNRDNSTDSRVLSQVGYVPIENIVGRAEIIFFSVGDGEARLEDLALAMVGALEPVVLDRQMSRKAKTARREQLEEQDRLPFRRQDDARSAR